RPWCNLTIDAAAFCYTKMMRNHIIIGVAILVAIVIGVLIFLYGDNKNAPSTPSSMAESRSVAVPFTKLAQGKKSTIVERVNYLITSPSELNELWKMIDATSTPPKIDFKKDAVIAVFAGKEPTTGYAISITEIEDADARTVSITLAKPSDSCMFAQVITAPYEIVTVPATKLPLTHEDIATTTNCP
ncbi:MAG: protease complex subunit PrcB family protein, partial [bacterium]